MNNAYIVSIGVAVVMSFYLIVMLIIGMLDDLKRWKNAMFPPEKEFGVWQQFDIVIWATGDATPFTTTFMADRQSKTTDEYILKHVNTNVGGGRLAFRPVEDDRPEWVPGAQVYEFTIYSKNGYVHTNAGRLQIVPRGEIRVDRD